MRQHTLLRIATCFGGRVEVQANCLPLFDYGRTPGTWSYDGDGYDTAHRARSGELDAATWRAACGSGRLGARGYGRTTLDEGESAWIALSWDGDASRRPRRGARAARGTDESSGATG